MQPTEALLRQIPNVDRLLKNEMVADSGLYRYEVTDALRTVLADLRNRLLAGEIDKIPEDDAIIRNAIELAVLNTHKGIRRVINGAGVILHSNLGRACLSKTAAEAVKETAAEYCTLEYDTEKGLRGSRTGHIEEELRSLTGCEAALVVNNNAAAMLLILTQIASGGNVVISRGELVEIGGGFRVPDIISQCGCLLHEVGTTNKTRLSDYEQAIDNDTRALLKVHASNFRIVGFTQSVTVKELSELGSARKIPVIEDIGSGALVDMRRFGIYSEPFAAQSLKDGADIVCFSGDKLLGGPQCGIILGRDECVSAMKRHPLYRVLRVDKMTIAALEATLRVYADPIIAVQEIPVLSMFSQSADALRAKAQKLCEEIRRRGGSAEVVPAKSAAGGGSVSGLDLDSFAVSPTGAKSATEIERALRDQPIPLISHIEKDRVLLDVRAIFESDFDYIAETVAGVTK